MNVEKLFSYGTLQAEHVQMALFGRALKGRQDKVFGHKLITVEVTDGLMPAISGDTVYSMLVLTNHTDDQVDGTVYDISSEELALADQYEDGYYERASVRLASGEVAWVYVQSELVANVT